MSATFHSLRLSIRGGWNIILGRMRVRWIPDSVGSLISLQFLEQAMKEMAHKMYIPIEAIVYHYRE
jgi:hypothetical protein